MRTLHLGHEYTREEVHSIFSPETKFTPQSGTWGLQGMIRVPDRPGDWVFFVTFGQAQGEHVFDESITDEGVLSWQSQPSQKLDDAVIRELIGHDDRLNTIHLFLRTRRNTPYGYFGALGYLTHDRSREQPVHFQWQLLDWPIDTDCLKRVGLLPVVSRGEKPKRPESPSAPSTLQIEQPPEPSSTKRSGVGKEVFQSRKSPDYAAKDARNRDLGLKGELLVIAYEKSRLTQAGRQDLADKIVHVSQIEGDYAGYDIRSYEVDGSNRFIEVKATRGVATTAFFISPNEIAFSAQNQPNYVLYRLYEFDDETGSAKSFLLTGNIAQHLSLEPTAFRAKLSAPVLDDAGNVRTFVQTGRTSSDGDAIAN